MSTAEALKDLRAHVADILPGGLERGRAALLAKIDALTAAMPQVDGEAISDAAVGAFQAAYCTAIADPNAEQNYGKAAVNNAIRVGIAAALPHLFAPLPFQGEPVTAELWRFLPGMPKPSQGDNYTADDMEAFALAALDNAAHLLASLRPAPLPPQGAAVEAYLSAQRAAVAEFDQQAGAKKQLHRDDVREACARGLSAALPYLVAPATDSHQGYIDAFYEIARVLGIEGARVESPKWVFENEILPRLKDVVLAATEAAAVTSKPQKQYVSSGGSRIVAHRWVQPKGRPSHWGDGVPTAEAIAQAEKNGFRPEYAHSAPGATNEDH